MAADRPTQNCGSACGRWPHERRRFGYRRLRVLLRREGFTVNHKRLFRLYREEHLMVRRRGGRERALGTRARLPASRSTPGARTTITSGLIRGSAG